MFESCLWDKPFLMIFSDNVFGSLVYYSHLTSLLLSLAVGFFIFFSNKKSLINRLLLIITILFSLWSFFDLILWATDKPQQTVFFWSLLILIEPLIYITSLYFLYVFINKKDTSTKFKIINLIIILPTIVLLSTKFAIAGFDFTNCDGEAIEGPLVYYGYAIEFIYAFWIFLYGINAYRKNKDKSQKQQILLVTIGLCLFLFSFAFGNIIGSLNVDWTLGQYGLFGLPLFVGFLAYLVAQYNALNTKVFTAQITSFLSILFVLALLFIQRIENVQIIVIPTVIILSILSYILVKSVKREITQRKEIEELAHQLEQSNEKLKGLDKLKTEFLSLASHQLRSPLTAIKGYASMLSEGSFGAIDDKPKEAVNRIYASAQGLVSIVEDLLNVSKIEQGGMKYEMMPTDISGIVTALYNEMKIPAENKHLEFMLDIPQYDKFMAIVDPLKMKQVFLNLTDNSIKYTTSGFVKLSLGREGNNIIFSVSDSGIGVTPETKKMLFEKFSRGEGGKMNTGGSGLGLYLAREIARAHKGDIVIESEGYNKGSTFKVFIPAAGAHVTPDTMPS